MLGGTEMFVAPNFVFKDNNRECVEMSLYTGRSGLSRTLGEVLRTLSWRFGEGGWGVVFV